jgi:hypothetical protein
MGAEVFGERGDAICVFLLGSAFRELELAGNTIPLPLMLVGMEWDNGTS